MNFTRYKFSKEAEPELLEFLKAVANQKSSRTTSNNVELWQKVLPVDETLQRKLNSLKVDTPIEVIDLTDENDEIAIINTNAAEKPESKKENLSQEPSFTTDLNEDNTIFKTSINENLLDNIEELLQTESVLSEKIIKRLGSEFSEQQLKDTFSLLAKDLNSECTLKLWRSIISTDCMERNTVALQFMQKILTHKIQNENNNTITTLFVEVINTLPDESIKILQKILLETDNSNSELTILRNNLNALRDDCKNILLKIFKDHCTRLESQQLGTVLSLITPHTSVENLNKIVELMFPVAGDFAQEKTFGKLLLEIVQSLGPNVVHKEEQLRSIISIYRSAFRTQIIKCLDRCLQDQKLLSQNSFF